MPNVLQQVGRFADALPSVRCVVLSLSMQMQPLGTADSLHMPKGAHLYCTTIWCLPVQDQTDAANSQESLQTGRL